MRIEVSNNNGYKYLRLVESKYTINSKGRPTCKKVTIFNIGPLSRFDDGKPDYVKRLRESFENGNPIIPSLIDYVDRKPVIEKYDLNLSIGDPNCIGHNKLFSNALIERILEEIGLITFVNRYKALTNYQFDLVGFIRLLIYGRILNPASKIATVSQNNNYYSDIIKDVYEYNVYDTLDFLYNYKTPILNRINRGLIEKFNRKTNIIYYDVTNFFFEIDEPDEDYLDEDNNLTKGIRKLGVSKEQRRSPIVQMGLFMDEDGLPISIQTFPGNTLDHLTMIDALASTIDNLNLPRFIFVGDRGMYRGNNAFYLTNKNNGYIISKSINKTAAVEKEWIFEPDGYIHEGKLFKYKSRTIKRKVKLNDGEYKEIVEKVVVYFSQKFYDKQMNENRSFLEFIEKLESSPTSFRLTKTQARDIKKFLKNEVINSKTGEILDSSELKPLIDFEKINKYKKQFGYYQIVTSELSMPDKEIINTYHGLARIEEQFKVMKGNLEARPMFVRTKAHIEAHLLVCMIALTVIRIIQNKIVDYKNNKTTKNWEVGLSGRRIQDALNKWTVAEIANGLYRFNDTDDKDLKLILDAFNIEIPLKLYKKMELLNLKTSIEINNKQT